MATVTPLPTAQLEDVLGSDVELDSVPEQSSASSASNQEMGAGADSGRSNQSSQLSQSVQSIPALKKKGSMGMLQRLTSTLRMVKVDKEPVHKIRRSSWWVLERDRDSHEVEESKHFHINNHQQEDTTTKIPPFIIHPHWLGRVAWDLLVVVLLTYSMFAIPFALAFLSQVSSQDQPALFWFDAAVDFLFFIDIVLNFRTAYFVSDAKKTWRLETSGRKIAVNYLKGWFIFDVVGTVPFDLIFSTSTGRATRVLRLPRILKLIRLFRMLKMGRLARYVSRFKEKVSINPHVMRLLRLIMIFVFLAHILACLLFFVGTVTFTDENGDDKSWLTEKKVLARGSNAVVPLRDAPLDVQYLMSIYWAFTTMTTVGYGDIKAITTWEYFSLIVTMTIGAAVFSFVVGNMASLISRLDGRAVAFKTKLDSVNEFMHQHNFPAPMRSRVRSYFEYCFAHPVVDINNSVMSELSTTMKIDCAKHLHRELLRTVPFFANCDQRFIDAVVMKLKPQQFGPGDYIFRPGEYGRSIYFIVGGEVSLTLPHTDEFIIGSYFPGNFFGENAFVSGKERRIVGAMARQWSDVFSLSAQDIHSLRTDFGQVVESVMKSAGNRWTIVEQIIAATVVARDSMDTTKDRPHGSATSESSQTPESRARAAVAKLVRAVRRKSTQPGSTPGLLGEKDIGLEEAVSSPVVENLLKQSNSFAGGLTTGAAAIESPTRDSNSSEVVEKLDRLDSISQHNVDAVEARLVQLSNQMEKIIQMLGQSRVSTI